ncbi:LURP-one-related family protein [Enterococcus sp. MJM12]|uniref:LURP-one-related family protein n=1 Tax=Candidatus Enterococcus myersii TaxID=2815322 RepID=A0ABS3H4J1_9ENTE|nr:MULTISPECIES: LURP-one-related family protein [unclassified Enterococcus]MBO0448324.1 LURP-one-related family protein [Enterococcus sp. MJM12]MCD1024256.1 LURP-one-related family protein [Enterococcus sp. SMC-9]
MRKLYIKQKVFSIGEKFNVTDADQEPLYHVQGSFLKIPKQFTIFDRNDHVIGEITKKVLALLPQFTVMIDDEAAIVIKKELTLFKARYHIEADGISVQGNWWDMDFEVVKDGLQIAVINKRWVSWGDTYEVTVFDERYEKLIVALVVAIDCVKADDNAAASSASS